jgi:uncharacterized membrane protein
MILRGRQKFCIALIAVAGILISSLSLYHHYGTSKTSFCNFGDSFNCDIVNHSTYSTIVGVPVALIGVLGYFLIFALATIYHDKAEAPILLLISSIGGLGFALYLTYVEKFVLAAWCILCLTSLSFIFAITALSAHLAIKPMRRD